ncbi:MAG TPA: hypothetical protein VFP56_08250 [Candidatus Limnocylindrales bacterium]|nr:hypothetical protein [Candidatus Limnocylindrales bacterium]
MRLGGSRRAAIAGALALTIVGTGIVAGARESLVALAAPLAVAQREQPAGPAQPVLSAELPAPPGTTERVSVADNEQQGDGASGGVNALIAASNADQAVSGDGRWVAFTSVATNLVGGAPSPGGLYLRDRQDGTTTAIPWIGGVAFPNGVVAAEPAVNRDGSAVAFTAIVTTTLRGIAVAAGAATPYVLVWDRLTGTEVVSVDSTGRAVPGYQPTISADGRYVAYTQWGPQVTPSPTPPADTSGPNLTGLTIAGATSCFDTQFCIFVNPGCGPPFTATVSITATDPSGVSVVRLYYRYGFSGFYTESATSRSGDTWSGTIDDGPGGAAQVDYYWEAFDTLGNRSTQGWTSSRVLRVEGCIL